MRVVDLKIEGMAFGGKGVGRENGKAVFVPYTIEDEVVSAEIVREKKQFAEADLIEVKERSRHRVEAPCPYFGRCGGCAYQHIDYDQQLEIKWQQVRDALQRIGKFQAVPMRPIIPSHQCYGYRNRITLHVEDGVIGFYRRDSHRLIDIERCLIAQDELNHDLAQLRSQPNLLDGHYTLRAGGSASPKTMLGSAASPPKLSTRSENAFHHFSQTNDGVANALRDLIVDLVPPKQSLLVDAYCGAGFFAKALLDKFEQVIGIDWDRFAIRAAKENATEKETYIAGDVDLELERLGVEATVSAAKVKHAGDTPATTLIVDPPATGLTANTRRAILDLGPSTLIYVSCNPPTLARDLKELHDAFTIDSVTPLDMFPQTAEIEVAVHLRAVASDAAA